MSWLHLVDTNPAQIALARFKLHLLETAAPEERLALNGRVEQVVQKGVYSRDELLAEVRALVRASIRGADDGRSSGGER